VCYDVGNVLACALIHCLRQTDPPQFTLFFSHSNGVDLGRLTKFLKFLGTQLQCNVFCYDYSGYGISSGTSSERDLLADGDGAFNELLSRYFLITFY